MRFYRRKCPRSCSLPPPSHPPVDTRGPSVVGNVAGVQGSGGWVSWRLRGVLCSDCSNTTITVLGIEPVVSQDGGYGKLISTSIVVFEKQNSCPYVRSTRPLAGASHPRARGSFSCRLFNIRISAAFWQEGLPLCARVWRLCSLEFCSTVCTSMIVKVVHCINLSTVYSRAKLTAMANSYTSDENCCRT